MSSAQNDRVLPTDTLGLFEMCGELIAVGQVAMATGHGRRQTMQTGDAGSTIGGRPSGLPTEDRKKACGGNSVPEEEQRVGDASGSPSKGAAMLYQTAVECTIRKYYELHHLAALRYEW